MEKRNREQIIIAGAERSGKTFYAEYLAKRYLPEGGVFAYNPGKPEDFSDYHEIEILEPSEIIHFKGMNRTQAMTFRMHPKLEYFYFQKKVYHFDKFRAMFYQKKVKMFRIAPQYEKFFWRVIFEYVSDFLVIVDDAKIITQRGIDPALFQLMSRKNHSGLKVEGERKGKGVDLVFIYHNLDAFNSQLFDYTTRLVMFKVIREPSDKIDNRDAYELMTEVYKKLLKEPQYTRYELRLRDVETPIAKKGQPIT